MKIVTPLLFLSILFTACEQKNQHSAVVPTENNKELSSLFDRYYEDRLKLFPLEATMTGDNRYNNLLYVDFTDTYRAKSKDFYQNYLNSITAFNRDSLNENDKISFDIFKREMEMNI